MCEDAIPGKAPFCVTRVVGHPLIRQLVLQKLRLWRLFDFLVKKGVEIGPVQYEFGRGVDVLRCALKKRGGN